MDNNEPQNQNINPEPINQEPAGPPTSPQVNVPTPQPVISEDSNVTTGGSASPPNNGGFKSKLKNLFAKKSVRFSALTAIIVILLGAGAYAAYQKIVVDNRPINVVKTAFLNSIQQQYITASANFAQLTGSKTSGSFTIQSDLKDKVLAANINFQTGKTTIPADLELTGGNLYFKIGNLSSAAGQLSTIPYASIVTPLLGELTSQWFVVPSSLYASTPEVKCYLNTDWSFTQSDINLLNSQFSKHDFATVSSSSATTLGSTSVEKYNLTIKNQTLSDYLSSLSGLSQAKAANSCNKNSSSNPPKSFTETGTTPITVWVNKGTKQIVRFESSYSDSTNKDLSGQGTVKFNYSKFTVTPPTNAKSIVNILNSLESSFSSSGSSL